jgi:hypothetical protein
MLFIVRCTLSCMVAMTATDVRIAPCFPLCYLLGLLDRIRTGIGTCYHYEGIC